MNATIAPSGQSYDGTQVFEAGTDYTLNLQYGKMDDGQVVRIKAPAGVTIPDSALVVPSGNTALTSLTKDPATGDILMTFANPFPSNINQGLIGLKFRFDTVTESVKKDVTWTVDSNPLTGPVIVKKPGDEFENVTPGAIKSASANAFSAISAGISMVNGTVVLDPAVVSAPIPYSLRVQTDTAQAGLNVADTLGQYLAFVGGGTATLTTWDASGLNKQVTTLAAPPIAAGSTSFNYTVDLPANSVLDVTYSAQIPASQLAALQADLQQKYDAVKAAGGSWQVELKNAAVVGSFNGGNPTNANGSIGGSVAGAWQPDLGYFQKSAFFTDGPGAQWTETEANESPWTFTEPVRVTWTLAARLSEWNETTPERTLTQNVIITDTLTDNMTWDTSDPSFVQRYNENTGVLEPMSAAPAGTTLADFSGDAFAKTYMVDGQTLYVNAGKKGDAHFRAISIVTNNQGGQNWQQNGQWIYRITNKASFDWSAGDDVVRPAEIDLRSEPGTDVTDPRYFTKTTKNPTLEIAPGESVWVPYQFESTNPVAKLSETTIVDYIDHNVFDVTEANLEEIRNTIATEMPVEGQIYYSNIGWSHPITPSDWDLSLDASGNLVIKPSASLLNTLAVYPNYERSNWRLALKLPTKKLEGTQTVEVSNRASITGTNTEVSFQSRTDSYASTWGDELEVRKSVWDGVNQQWTTSVRVPLTDDDELTEDTFTYQVRLMPHGEYQNVAIIPVDDLLPEGVEFVGFADSATSASVTTGTKLLPGNLQASYDSATRTVKIANQTGTVLQAQPTIDALIRVKIVDFTPDVGITNVVSGNPATVVPTNDYPLNILKKDSSDPTKLITDPNAKFEIRNSAGDLIETAQVANGVLVVSDGNGGTKALTVTQPGTYTITETRAPAGYAPTTTVYTAVANANGSSPQVTIPNAPTQYVSIGDYVWWDANRDGLQTSGEAVVPNLPVELYRGGSLVATTATDSAGYYSFGDLEPSTEYTVKFVKPTGTTNDNAVFFTTQNSAAASDNSPTADVNDSDADPTTGRVTLTTPASGANRTGHNEADNPGIDAGFVQYNLSIKKSLVTTGPFVPGMQVTYQLTPHNDGPVAALAGWSVTDVLPAQLTGASISGDAGSYTCDQSAQRCVATAPLAAGADGPVVTVTATIGGTFSGTAKNVAYVSPAQNDVAETNPLDVPTLATNTGSSRTDNDAQAELSVPLVSMGDFVWFDTNRDGLQSQGEPVVPNVVVNLYRAGELVGTTSTNTQGYYWFTDLLPATAYTVEFVKPTGTSFTSQNSGNVTSNDPQADGVDSDANPVNGRVDFTTPSTGSNVGAAGQADNPGIDAGLVKYNLQLAKTRTTTEVVYKGDTVTFTLTPRNDGPVDALAGWSVTEVLPEQLTLVSMSGTGYTFDAATATVTNNSVLAAGATGNPITVTATVNRNLTGDVKNVAYVSPAPGDGPETNPLGTPPTDTNVDTSETPTDNDAEAPIKGASLVSIGDYVWIDVNRDGAQGDGNPVEGVTVNLYAADGTTLIASTETNAQGFYSFGDLRPGVDVVVEFVKPEGYAFTTQNEGGDTADSDADRSTGRVNVTTPAAGGNSLTAPDDPTIDAGLVRFNLTLTKEITSSGPYYEGSTVTFLLTPHNDGPADALGGWSVAELPESGLTITKIDGGDAYDCELDALNCVSDEPLAAGADGAPITVTAVIAENFVGVLHNVAYVIPSENDVPETNPLEKPENPLVDTDETRTDNDDSKLIPVDSLVSEGDYVWWDNDRDGLQGEDEPPVPGVIVNLLDANGELLKSTKTDEDGYYVFDDLVPGRAYTIEFVKPAGASFTTRDVAAGEDDTDASDSDANIVTGRVDFIADAEGENRTGHGEADNPTIDAGFVSFNLSVVKRLVSSGSVTPGATLTYEIVPRNEGPSDILAGWSVRDNLPAGLTLVSMSGDGYECTANTCTAGAPLKAGTDGSVVTVVTTVNAGTIGQVINTANVLPFPGDVPETDPKDNRHEAKVTVVPALSTTGAGLGAQGLTGLLGAAGVLLLGGGLLLGLRRRKAHSIR